MRTIRTLLTGLFFGVLLGLWLGINIGRGRPLLANPFAEPALQERLKGAGGELLDKSGELLDQGKDAVRRKLGE